ncbi:unnamed protein product [Natator depressus]
MLSGVLHGGSKEAALTEKIEQVEDHQAGVTQNFLGTDKSSKEKTVETHPNKEPESNISDEQDLAHASLLIQHKPAVEYEKELQLLNQWYKLDENYDPRVYRLLPIRQEIDQGFQVQGSPEDHCHCFKRNIRHIQYYLSSKQASKCIDIHQLRPVVNARLYEAHQNFIDSIHARSFVTLISMKRVLAEGKDRINPISNRSHACYLERLCSDFQKIVITHFNRMTCSKNFPEGLDARKRKQVYSTYTDEEILEHVQHCQALGSSIGEHHLLGAGVGHRRSAICGGWDGGGEKALQLGDLRAIIRFVGIAGESRNI